MHNGILCSSKKKKVIQIAAPQINLEDILLSKDRIISIASHIELKDTQQGSSNKGQGQQNRST